MLITIRDLSVHVNVKLSMSLFNVMGVRKMSLARNCPLTQSCLYLVYIDRIVSNTEMFWGLRICSVPWKPST